MIRGSHIADAESELGSDDSSVCAEEQAGKNMDAPVSLEEVLDLYRRTEHHAYLRQLFAKGPVSWARCGAVT